MTPIRRKLISKTVLEILQSTKPYLMPESTLLAHVNLVVRPPVSGSDLGGVLGALETGKCIVRTEGDDQIPKAKITEIGEVELLES